MRIFSQGNNLHCVPREQSDLWMVAGAGPCKMVAPLEYTESLRCVVQLLMISFCYMFTSRRSAVISCVCVRVGAAGSESERHLEIF